MRVDVKTKMRVEDEIASYNDMASRYNARMVEEILPLFKVATHEDFDEFTYEILIQNAPTCNNYFKGSCDPDTIIETARTLVRLVETLYIG